MKRTVCTILSIVALSTAFISLAGRVSYAENLQEPQSANLYLPTSYEQYLPLNAPTDVSVTSRYTAISDSNKIYVYNATENKYSVYNHELDGDPYKITKLQFADNGYLYFTDSSNKFYALDPASMQIVNIPNNTLQCTTFSIISDTVYYTKISAGVDSSYIYKSFLSDLSKSERLDTGDKDNDGQPDGISGKIAIALYDGSVYYTNTDTLRIVGNESYCKVLRHSSIESMAIRNGNLYYVIKSGGTNYFYVYELSQEQTLTSEEPKFVAENCSSVSVSDKGEIMVVQGTSIRKYSETANQFTDFEICSSSSTEKRLSDANDVSLYGNKLLISDKGNKRVTTINTDTNEITTQNLSFEPLYSATDGETLLTVGVSNAQVISNNEVVYELPALQGTVTGVTCVYGTYYLTTDSTYYRISKEDDAYVSTSAIKSIPSVKYLTSDIYGYLYVGYSDYSVHKFSEDEFISYEDNGAYVCTTPTDAVKIAVDFDRTLYALSNNTVYDCTNTQTALIPEFDCVYSGDTATATSFALGNDTNTAYFLCNGNFVAKTDINIKTVKNIPIENSAEEIFSSNAPEELSIVSIPEKTVYFYFDLPTLKTSENFFPYTKYERSTSEITTIKIGEAGRFNVIAVYNATTKTYDTALVESASCTSSLPESEFLKPIENFNPTNTGYISNTLPLYKYPFLTDFLTVETLTKDESVKVLNAVDDLDYNFYYVEYLDKDGNTHKGFVPQNYVKQFNGATPESTPTLYGEKSSDKDSVWQLAYILLGCTGVAVLIDFLILRKKKQ